MTAVGLVTIHHEGAGKPRHVDLRGAGYTYAVFPGAWERYRTVASSFATGHFNHVSVDVVLTGDRCAFDVTDPDIERIGACVADARHRGEVIANPLVRAHGLTPHNATRCPCDHTYAVFGQIVKACQGAIAHPLPPHPGHPTLAPGAHSPAVAELQHKLNAGAGYHLAVDGLFGHVTLLAVQAFQAFFHLAVDGIVGPQTWALVDYCYALHEGR